MDMDSPPKRSSDREILCGWLSTLADALHGHAQDEDAVALSHRARALLDRLGWTREGAST